MSEEAPSATSQWGDHERAFWDAYRAEVKSLASFQTVTVLDENRIMAKHLVKEERGDYGPYGVGYKMDGSTIGLLLSHTRQDTAHVLMNSSAIWKELQSIKRALLWMSIILVGIFGLLVRSAVTQ